MVDNSRINNNQIQFHVKKDDPKADERARKSNLEAAAKALVINFEGHKGSGDKAYIQTVEGKKSISDISVWMNKLDTNKDGIITADEVKKGGGDKYDILKLRSDEATQKKMSKEMVSEQLLGGMKVLEEGLTSPWFVAKSIVYANTDKQGLKNLFSCDKVRNYYNKNLWGANPEEVKKNESVRSHMKDVFKHHKMSEADLKSMGFTPEQIKYFMN